MGNASKKSAQKPLEEQNQELELEFEEYVDKKGRTNTLTVVIEFETDEEFEKCFGRKADKKRKIYNGRLECTYYSMLAEPPKKAEKTEKAAESKKLTD